MKDMSADALRLAGTLDVAIERLERARPFAKKRHQRPVLDVVSRLMAQPGGPEVVFERAVRIDHAGLFAGSDWDTPTVLLPQLVARSLASGDKALAALETVSLMRFVAVATGAAHHPVLQEDHARHFLTQVLALNLPRFFDFSDEAGRAAGVDCAEVSRVLRFVAGRVGLRDVLGALVAEIWRILEQRPVQVASSDNLVWLALKRQILPFIPVFDKGERTDGTFSRSDFTWEDKNDRYICPGGKELRHTWRTYSDPKRNAPSWRVRKYRAQKSDCTECALKTKCCPNSEARAIHREKYEIVRDFARQCTASQFNPTAQKRRKKVEMLFAHLKRILGLGRLRLRGPCGVQDEFALAATAQNLRKLAKLKPSTPVAG